MGERLSDGVDMASAEAFSSDKFPSAIRHFETQAKVRQLLPIFLQIDAIRAARSETEKV